MAIPEATKAKARDRVVTALASERYASDMQSALHLCIPKAPDLVFTQWQIWRQ